MIVVIGPARPAAGPFDEEVEGAEPDRAAEPVVIMGSPGRPEGRPADLKATIEAALRETFGYDAWIVLYDIETVRAIVAAYPFDADREGWHPYVVLASEPNAFGELTALSEQLNPELERIAQRKIEVFLAREDYILQHIGTLRGRQADVPRRHIRYDIGLPVMYQFCTRLGSPVEVKQHEGFTINISEGGMLVNGPKAQVGSVQDILRKGLCLSVVLAFNTPQEIRCICRVKSIREADAGWQIGMQL